MEGEVGWWEQKRGRERGSEEVKGGGDKKKIMGRRLNEEEKDTDEHANLSLSPFLRHRGDDEFPTRVGPREKAHDRYMNVFTWEASAKWGINLGNVGNLVPLMGALK